MPTEIKVWDYVGWTIMDPHDPTDAVFPVTGTVSGRDEYEASRAAENALWAYVGLKGPAAGAQLLNWYVKEKVNETEV